MSVDEDEAGLRVLARPSERKKGVRIDVAQHDWPSIITVLTTVYRRGYDEVTVTYASPEEYQRISAAVRSLLGFAIMENKKGACLIKSLPSAAEQDFQTMFRRVFLILLQQLDDLAENLGDAMLIKNFYHRDADVNAIVNLAIRMINNGFVNDRFQELHLFHALVMLEECGDDIARFTIEIQNVKDAPKLKEAVTKCASLLRLLYDGYFQKKVGIQEFYKQYYLYWPGEKKLPAPLYDFFVHDSKSRPVFYVRSIVEKCIHLAEILLLPQVQNDVFGEE